MMFRLIVAAILALPGWAQAPAGRPAARPAPRPAAARAAAPAGHKELKFAALRLFEPPQPVRVQLPNGMKVLLLEDHDTPLVTITATVRAGSVFDPPGRAGLATVTGNLLRNGGTGRRTPDRVDADLELLGATLEGAIAEATTSLTLTTLREGLAEALDLYHEALTDPAFRQDKLDYAKAVIGQSVLRRNDDPREILGRELRALLYGRETRPEYSTLARISRADVKAYYKRYFFPANIVLSVCGDFDSAQLKGSLETLFGSWKEQQAPVAIPKFESKPAPGGYVAVRPELRETLFAVGQPGPQFNEADTAALEVAAAILGAGPNSRLLTRARASSGAVREMGAEYRPGFGRPGQFLVSGGGMSTAGGETVRMILDEIQKLRAAEVSEDALRIARDAVLMKLVSGLDSKTRALAAVANLEHNGYPSDAIQQYQKSVAAVTRADVLRVAQTRLDPDKMTVVAVSNLSVFSQPLDPRGGASAMIDRTAAPRAASGPAAPGSAEIAKTLLARAQQASGGASALEAIKDYTQTATYVGADGSRETQTDRWLAPSYLRQDAQSSRFGTLVRYTDGEAGWISNGRNSMALAGVPLQQAKEEVLRAYIPMLLSDRLPGRTIAALDEQTVEISMGGASARLVLDPQTGLPARLLYELQTEQQQIAFVEEEYSDFRDAGGVKAPFAITVRRNGVKHADGAVSDFKVNTGIKPEVLQRRP